VSIEIHVLFHGKLPSKAALTRCFKDLDFPLRFPPGSGSLEQHKGYLPMRLRGEESGVEFDTYDGRDAVVEIAGRETDPRFTRSANLRLGGDENELTVAQCFAAALARLVDGAVFDPEEAGVLTADDAIARARQLLKDTATKTKFPGTRPADIKRYLKPLLQMRRDLVLVGRLLLIRPVRHLLRGVQLEPTSDKYTFKVRRYVVPLFSGRPARMWDDSLDPSAFCTWQPHFEPLLMDRLAEEIFSEAGRMTTMVDLAGAAKYVTMRTTALVLAGEAERAAELAREGDRAERARSPLSAPINTEHFERVMTDVGAFCAECHAKEAAFIRGLKLDHVWEPTPFPIDLPASQRDERTADPSFVTTPWPARPAWLWQEMPRQSGEVRYAQEWYRHGGEKRLLVALTAAEAEARFRANEDYVLAARLPDGALLFVKHSTGQDRNQPRPEPHLLTRHYHVHLQSRSHEVFADACFDFDSPHLTEMGSIHVWERGAPRSVWSLIPGRHDGIIRVYDERSGERVLSKRPITPEDRELRTLQRIEFGEHAIFAERVRLLLRMAGYGEFS